MKRAANFVAYGLFAALGAGLLARPALLTLRSLGLWHPVLAWEVPLGWVAVLLLSGLAALTLRLAVRAALSGKPRLAENAALLGLVSAALALRALTPEASPAAEPTARLIAGLRAAADQADALFAQAHAYPLEEAELSAGLQKLPSPGFVFRARALPLRARVVAGAAGPELAAQPGDLPGTVLFAVSPGRTRAWLTVVTLASGKPQVLLSAGKPLVLQARAGTHSAPGRDPLVPSYPGMKAVGNARPR